ncbi:hypothetical protein [Frankia sp. CIT1]|uniref:hypothetical protein n=1 Tax=Frankia sp. CIT1 TaxID=2880974 RepID=UPI001EF4491A|nr:hypothetical protein [Frankia sp. CIT1]
MVNRPVGHGIRRGPPVGIPPTTPIGRPILGSTTAGRTGGRSAVTLAAGGWRGDPGLRPPRATASLITIITGATEAVGGTRPVGARPARKTIISTTAARGIVPGHPRALPGAVTLGREKRPLIR